MTRVRAAMSPINGRRGGGKRVESEVEVVIRLR